MKIVTRIAASLLLLVGALTACGADDATTSIEDWVAEFDRLCVEMGAALSDPTLSEAEFAEISSSGITEMRAIPSPDPTPEEARSMLDAIEATSTDLTLTDDEISSYDEQFFVAATTLGVSEECLFGASG